MQCRLVCGILNRNAKRNTDIRFRVRVIDGLSWLHTSSSSPPPPPPPPDTIVTTTVHTSSTSDKKEDLDFWKAADILFSEVPNQKKFGWDFHLWQLFVACLPSVAIYFTAQYARREMRRMEKEREQENAEKLKIQAKDRDQENRLLPGFQALEARLGAIEEKINEIEAEKEKIIALVIKDGEQLKDVESGKTIEKNVMEQANVEVKDVKALTDQKGEKETNDTEQVNEESKRTVSLENKVAASTATSTEGIKVK